MIVKYRVTFHHIANDLYVVVDVVSTTPEQAVRFSRRRFNLDDSWFHDGTETLEKTHG